MNEIKYEEWLVGFFIWKCCRSSLLPSADFWLHPVRRRCSLNFCHFLYGSCRRSWCRLRSFWTLCRLRLLSDIWSDRGVPRLFLIFSRVIGPAWRHESKGVLLVPIVLWDVVKDVRWCVFVVWGITWCLHTSSCSFWRRPEGREGEDCVGCFCFWSCRGRARSAFYNSNDKRPTIYLSFSFSLLDALGLSALLVTGCWSQGCRSLNSCGRDGLMPD